MDTLVHGLIGTALCSRTGLPGGRRGPLDAHGPRRWWADWTLWAAFGFGILPDALSLGIYFLSDLLMGRSLTWQGIPPWVFFLYNTTHSLLGMALILGLLAWRFPALRLPLLAWPLHVLMDVPTHGESVWGTPLLWPFSSWTFSGWNWWLHKEIFIGSWLLAGALWLAVALLRLTGRKS
ncbi:MAG TPA: hypothetical protein PLD40_03685 [Kiritimatiellia bacterium]|nr:hypothetical protein [Kiritimatiellia bacterium]